MKLKNLTKIIIVTGFILLSGTFSSHVFAATKIWEGDVNGSWLAAPNWLSTGYPSNGDDIYFGPGYFQTVNNDIPGSTIVYALNSLIFEGSGYSLGGNLIGLSTGIFTDDPITTFTLPIRIDGNAIFETARYINEINLNGNTLTFDSREGDINLLDDVTGNGGVIFTSSGVTTSSTILNSPNTFIGPITVNSGYLTVNFASGLGDISNVVTVTGGELVVPIGVNVTNTIILNGGILSGHGAVTDLQGTSGSISPGLPNNIPYRVGYFVIDNDLNLSSGHNLIFDLDGVFAGVTHDVLEISGNTDLGNSTLSLNLGYTPTIGDTFSILYSVGTLTGNFNGLPEGETFSVGGNYFIVNYTANEVILTAVEAPIVIPIPEDTPILSDTGINLPLVPLMFSILALSSGAMLFRRKY